MKKYYSKEISFITSQTRRCLQDYNMISPNDRIAVAVSGGKDSMAALFSLLQLKQYYHHPFEMCAITLDLGFSGCNYDPITKYCNENKIEHHILKTQISEVVFETRKEDNPCALCAKMRRGALYSKAADLGYSKVVLGHHKDDVVITFLLSLLYEGRISTFQPVSYLDRTDITLLRPMIYCREDDIHKMSMILELPLVANPCPVDKTTKRNTVKEIANVLCEESPDLYEKIFGAIQRKPLDGWDKSINV